MAKKKSTKASTQAKGTKSTKKRTKKKISHSRLEKKPDEIPFALPVVSAAKKRKGKKLLEALEKAYPDAHCELEYESPHELLIATILSAQATDVSVNKATPALFQAFPSPVEYAAATPEKIEPYIKTIGLFRNKAKSIHAATTEVVEQFGGKVPQTMAELLTLRGVARKTANVVLSNAFGMQVGFVVDTHIARLARRFCLVDEGTSVPMIERELMAIFPRERWGDLSHMFIWHGRRACKARGGACADHPVCRAFGKCCELDQ